MARLGLQRRAELEIALEFGGDLGVISDVAMNTASGRTRFASFTDLSGPPR
jgi:hypothetical protein